MEKNRERKVNRGKTHQTSQKEKSEINRKEMAIGKSTKFEEKEQQRRIERVIENKRERKGL